MHRGLKRQDRAIAAPMPEEMQALPAGHQLYPGAYKLLTNEWRNPAEQHAPAPDPSKAAIRARYLALHE